eukprot:gene26802-35490_t
MSRNSLDRPLLVSQEDSDADAVVNPMAAGSSCKMGSTVVRGEVETAALLGGTNEMSNFQKLLVSIVLVLTGISSVLCLILMIYLSTVTSFDEALSFTVVVMEVVTTTTLALGSKELGKAGPSNETEGMSDEDKAAHYNASGVFKTTKGAPHVILKLVNKSNRENRAELTEKVESDGDTSLKGATDAARAAADIVLTQPGLSTIVNVALLSSLILLYVSLTSWDADNIYQT